MKTKVNAYIMALYIFQFGLIQPVASLLNSQAPVGFFSLLLLVIMFMVNGFRIKRYVVVLFIVLSSLFLLHALINQSSSIAILESYLDFILKGFSGIVFASLITNNDHLFKSFFNVSLINAAAMSLYPFTDFMSSVNYMRFGYAMVPSAIMLWYGVLYKQKHKIIWIILALYTTGLTVIYGSRGAIIVLILAFFFYILFNNAITRVLKITIITLFGTISYLFIHFNLLLRFVNYLIDDLGFSTYAMIKIRMMLNTGLAEASSGRNEIYQQMWEMIQTSPIFGNGLLHYTIVTGSTPHNILLQILVEFGIFGLLVWFVIWLASARKFVAMSKEGSTDLFAIANLVVALSLGRLMVSSDMWLRPEYWFALSMLIGYQYKRNMEPADYTGIQLRGLAGQR